MSEQLQLRRGTFSQVAAFTGAQGEPAFDITNERLVLNDGATAGGWPHALETRRAVADAATTILVTDRLVAYTALTAARAVTLCAASAYPSGARLTIVDESGNCSSTLTITLNRAGSDTIDGASSFAINAAYASATLESNGASAWTVVAPSMNMAASLVGIGTAPDPSNPLSVYGASALFNGANFNIAINKAAAADTASILFEDGFSGRAQMGLNGSDNYSLKVSPNGSAWTTAIALDAATGAATLANLRTSISDAAYAVLATDREVAYTAITAARAVTLPAASAYPAGQPLLIVDESGAVSTTNTLTVNRAGSDTISGKTNAVLSGANGYLRLVSNGSNEWTVVGRSVNVVMIAYAASPFTYAPTPGMQKVDVYLIGGGGGGGGGALQAASTAVSGGGGGGSGGCNFGVFSAAEVGASLTVTIGAAGTGGAAASTSSTAGGAGGQGGATTFGSLLQASAGGGGSGGQLAAASAGGGGGGSYNSGSNASGSTAGSAGSLGTGSGGSGGGGAASTTPCGGSGGGGSTAAGAASNGGNGYFGPSGGASGGGVSAANATSNGGNGGSVAFKASTASGGAGAGAAGFSPSLSATPLNQFHGAGGAGGASSLTAAYAGGAGGAPGGGGGGGGSAQNGGAAGAGGAGGAGYAIVVEYF